MLGGYQKYTEGIRYVRRVSENQKNLTWVFVRVSKILGGYQKYKKVSKILGG